MNELWSNDQQQIVAELNRLIKQRLPVSLQTRGGQMASSRLRMLAVRAGTLYLVMERPAKPFPPANSIVAVSYKAYDGPIMTFPVTVDRVYKNLLATVAPRAIYYIQRRRYPRYQCKHRAVAAFLIGNRPRVCTMQLADISRGGVRLCGVPRYELERRDLIGPATYTMVAEQQVLVKELTIAQSQIVRSLLGKNMEWQFGVRFILDAAERRAVDNLLADPFATLLFSSP